jgi:hypothetical protein
MVLPSRDELGVPEFELVETARYQLRALSDSLLELDSQHMDPGLALPGGLAPVPGQGDGMGQIPGKVLRSSCLLGDVYVHVHWRHRVITHTRHQFLYGHLQPESRRRSLARLATARVTRLATS